MYSYTKVTWDTDIELESTESIQCGVADLTCTETQAEVQEMVHHDLK